MLSYGLENKIGTYISTAILACGSPVSEMAEFINLQNISAIYENQEVFSTGLIYDLYSINEQVSVENVLQNFGEKIVNDLQHIPRDFAKTINENFMDLL